MGNLNCIRIFLVLSLITCFSHVSGQNPWATLTLIGSSDGPFYAKQYFAQNTQMNWASAVNFCKSYGLQLASVESAADQLVITNWAKDSVRANEWGFFWLSGNKLGDGTTWRWLEDSKIVPTPGNTATGPQYWIGGEPSTTANTANCLHVNLGWYKGGWGQHFCETLVMRPLCMYKMTTSCQGANNTIIPTTTLAPPLPTTQSQPTCSCGTSATSNTRIIGGQPAALGEIPWRCNLYMQRYGVFCTCTIISASWIMTAAHCTDIVTPTDILYVDVGDLDLGTASETASYLVQADRVIGHPGWDKTTISNDIALIHLKDRITFSPTVQPACLPFPLRGQSLDSRRATISGWGTTVFQGPISQKLNKVDVTILSDTTCRSVFGPGLPQNILCTGETGKSACSGDSGGSVDLVNNGRSYAVGVTSFVGAGCNTNYPNVFTRVTSYLDWIVSTTGEQFCQA